MSTLWRVEAVSWTVPTTSPAVTLSPRFAMGTNFHFFFLSRASAETPLLMMSPTLSLMTGRGLWIPSKIDVASPGPSSADSGAPVLSTLSPGLMPVVSS